MSADNWATCPSCYKDHLDYLVEAQENLKNNYGKVDVDEWLAEREKVEKLRITPFPDQSLREDYEIYISMDGLLKVSYKARCGLCDFSFEYKHEERAFRPEKVYP